MSTPLVVQGIVSVETSAGTCRIIIRKYTVLGDQWRRFIFSSGCSICICMYVLVSDGLKEWGLPRARLNPPAFSANSAFRMTKYRIFGLRKILLNGPNLKPTRLLRHTAS